MLGLTTIPYYPDAAEMQILEWFDAGYKQTEMAGKLGITKETMRQRVAHLRESIGARTNEQMMSRYGMYKERTKNNPLKP